MNSQIKGTHVSKLHYCKKKLSIYMIYKMKCVYIKVYKISLPSRSFLIVFLSKRPVFQIECRLCHTKPRSPRVLITGGLGQLGTGLARELRARYRCGLARELSTRYGCELACELRTMYRCGLACELSVRYRCGLACELRTRNGCGLARELRARYRCRLARELRARHSLCRHVN